MADTVRLRDELLRSLGDDLSGRYWAIFREYMIAKLSKKEMDSFIMTELSAEQILQHNTLCCAILHNADATAPSPGSGELGLLPPFGAWNSRHALLPSVPVAGFRKPQLPKAAKLKVRAVRVSKGLALLTNPHPTWRPRPQSKSYPPSRVAEFGRAPLRRSRGMTSSSLCTRVRWPSPGRRPPMGPRT